MNSPEGKILVEKVDRLEHHFKVYKSDLTDTRELSKEIRSILIGCELSDHKGVIHLLKEIEKRVDELSDRNILLEENMQNVKWAARGFIAGLISFILWLIQK